MQYKDVTPIIAELVRLKNSIPLEIDVGRYLPEVRKNTHGEAVRSGLKKALRVIEQAPAVAAMPRWNNVADKLPFYNTTVLCIDIDNKHVFIGNMITSHLYQNKGVLCCTVQGLHGVRYATYWMPLPEPPKEDSHV